MVELHTTRLVGFNGLASVLPQKSEAKLENSNSSLRLWTERRGAPQLAELSTQALLFWNYQGCMNELSWVYHGTIMQPLCNYNVTMELIGYYKGVTTVFRARKRPLAERELYRPKSVGGWDGLNHDDMARHV